MAVLEHEKELTAQVNDWATETLPAGHFRKVHLIRTSYAAFPAFLAFDGGWQTHKIQQLIADGYVVHRTWVVTPELQAAALARLTTEN